MPIAVVCPGCNSRLNAPEAAAGKTVKCPKCKAPLVIPEPDADPGFETVDDPVPSPKKPAAASAKAPAVKTDVMLDDDDDDEEEKPRAKKKSREVEDEDEDEDDDRPKKKGKGKGKKKSKGSPVLLIGAIAGGILLLVGAFCIYWFAIREDKPKETANNTTPNVPPGGPQPGGPGPGGFVPPGGGGPSPPPSGPVKPLYETATSTNRQISSNNLKQFGLAMHNFASVYNGAFPAGIYDSTGKVGLSWRVAILPYIEQESLYAQFKLDEPWNSEHNKKLIPMMPKLFAAPGQQPNDGYTYYRSFTGPDTAFPPPTAGRGGQPAMGLRMSGVTDGLSNTGFIVEAGDPVEWTKPDELVFTVTGPLPRVGGIFGDGYFILLGDGRPQWMKTTASPDTLKAIITARGGEIVDFNK